MKGDDRKFFKEMTGPVPLAKSIMSGELEDYHYNNLNNLNEHGSLNVLLLKLHHIPPCNAMRHSQHAHQQTKSASDIGTDLHLPASWQHLRDSLEPMRSMVEIVYGKMFASQTLDWLDRKMLAWKELGASFTLSYFWYCAVLRDWPHRTELWSTSGASVERPLLWEVSGIIQKYEERMRRMAAANSDDFHDSGS